MYAKVFAQILDSSIADDYQLRHFFTDMLVLADIEGCVDMTPAAIAARTRIPLAEVTVMLAKLEEPDPESRTPDADGRRIERLDDHRTWGWHIINYSRFRLIACEEQRREKARARVAVFREKRLQKPPCNAPVTHGNAGNAMQRQKQMEMEKKSKKVKLVNPSPEKPLTNLTLSAASLARMCREIADNKHGWFWDNCKVEPAQIVAASLKSILQPYIGQLDEPAVHSAWLEAVKRTHGATVDALAINPAAYCVGCFKDQLNDAVTRTAN